MNSVLIIGCGDIGLRVAKLCRSAALVALVRTPGSLSRLRAEGFDGLTLDLDRPFSTDRLPAAGREVYYFAPPPAAGHTDPRVAAVCAALGPGNRPLKLVYISTSAVYGDCGGRWIDEKAPLQPGSARGHRRLDAERQWLSWGEKTGVPVVLLRVPGIYGPQKLPVSRLRRGMPVLAANESPYTNRIHVDDLAQVCVTAMQRGKAGEAYNVSDGHPTCMTDYFNRVADSLRLPRPPVVDRPTAERELSRSMLSFLSESKRLDNTKMIEQLGIELRYPNLESGLAACVQT